MRLLAVGAGFGLVVAGLAVPAAAEDFQAATRTSTIAAGEAHTVLIAGDGTPWAFGSNGELALGIADGQDRIAPAPMEGWPANRRAVSVAAGQGFTLVVDDRGGVWAAGSDQFGQQGDGIADLDTVNQVLTPMVGLPAGVRAVDVAAGPQHALVITDDGRLFGAGRNDTYQLGGTTDQSSLVEVEPAVGAPRIVDAAAGTLHSIALTSTGEVLGIGSNAVGALAANSPGGTVTSLSLLAGLPAGIDFTSVAAGFSHSVVLGDNGRAYAMGRGLSGELGHGATPAAAFAPVRMQADGVSAIAAAGEYSLLLTEAGTPLATGDNEYGQLGRPLTTTFSSTPHEMVAGQFSRVRPGSEISAGQLHPVMRAVDGVLFSAGENTFRQTGTSAGNPVIGLTVMNPQVVRGSGRPSVQGSAVVGTTLSFGPGTWVPSSVSHQYQVLRDGASVSFGPAAYDVTGADAGRTLLVRDYGFVTSWINDTFLESQPIRVPAANTARPSISGQAKVGKKLTGSIGTWSGAGYTYRSQWLRGGKPIKKATASTYTVTAKDKGAKLSLRVTATKAGFATVVATSKTVRVR